jgi:hypothetical protein
MTNTKVEYIKQREGTCEECLIEYQEIYLLKDYPEKHLDRWVCLQCLSNILFIRGIADYEICKNCQSICYSPNHRPKDGIKKLQSVYCESCAFDYDQEEFKNNLSQIFDKALEFVDKTTKKAIKKIKNEVKKGGDK